MNPKESHKLWANFLRTKMGGLTSVTMYDDDSGSVRIPIFTSENQSGIVGATIGLMDVDLSKKNGVELRTEILIDSRLKDERVLNVLSTIAFFILKDQWRVSPGVIFENIVSMYFPTTELPHIYFTAPYQWSEMNCVNLEGVSVYPLLAIPISERERILAQGTQGAELEQIWEDRNTDVLNWHRASVV